MPSSLLKFVQTYSVKVGGRKYPAVKIGNQLWMAENLDYKFDVNGSPITIGTSSLIYVPAAWYYGNSETDYGIDGTYKCGLLYNKYAAEYLETNKAALLPDGWHVPTLSDYETLAATVGNDSSFTEKLKARDASVTQSFPSSWAGIDQYGLNILPCGYYYEGFYEINTKSQLWTSTAAESNLIYSVYFRQTSKSLEYWADGDQAGLSIRLVKTLS